MLEMFAQVTAGVSLSTLFHLIVRARWVITLWPCN